MEVIRFFNRQNYGNCYAVIEGDNFVLIDCTQTPDFVKNKIGKEKVCKGVIITHGHYDHISNIQDWINLGVDIFANNQAFEKMNNAEWNYSTGFGLNFQCEVPLSLKKVVEDGQILDLLGKEIKIHYLPGHTDCSIAIEIENNLFVGDIIFDAGGYGRCDLVTGSIEQMKITLQKISKMNSDLNIKPGHGLGFKLREWGVSENF